MPRLALVAMAGFRIREPEMLALGMRLPSLAQRAAAVGALPSLGLLTLAGLTPAHWEMTWHESTSQRDPESLAALAERIVATRPDLAAISALTASIDDAYTLAGLLRRRGVRVVLGGLHVTSCPDEASQQCDAVVVGEAEGVWERVLEDAAAGRLATRYRAEKPFDLGQAPLPRWDLLGGRARPRYTLQTSRGCPFACDFCGASRLLGPFREKPTERIAAELKHITSRQPRACIELADDNTFAGRRDPAPLLGVMARRGVRWFTECDWRIGERPDVLGALAASGCVQVLVGVETMEVGAESYSGFGAKRAPLARVERALENIQEAGVAVIGCFVVGGDHDDEESIMRLGQWLLEAPLADVQITVQTPFPGTPLRERLAREGRLLPDRGWESCTLFDVAYQPARMTVQSLERAFRYLVALVHAPQAGARRAAIRKQVWAQRYGAKQESA
ncbi:MAG: cobalamin-dependent protein [Phycisphaeraceae bacterium]|nr:cobalamin-dependent protein [Phycisphaeraceae bacterium]